MFMEMRVVTYESLRLEEGVLVANALQEVAADLSSTLNCQYQGPNSTHTMSRCQWEMDLLLRLKGQYLDSHQALVWKTSQTAATGIAPELPTQQIQAKIVIMTVMSRDIMEAMDTVEEVDGALEMLQTVQALRMEALAVVQGILFLDMVCMVEEREKIWICLEWRTLS